MSTYSTRDRAVFAAVRGGIVMFLLGMIGVVALAVYTVPSLRELPELATFSYPMLLVLAAANSTVLLAVFVLLGTATAPKIGLQSHIYAWAANRDPEWEELAGSVTIAVVFGVGIFILIMIIDVLFAPFVRLDAGAVPSDSDPLLALAASIPMRLLYGGITEEILLRWGVMAPVAWVLWRLKARSGTVTETPSAKTMWIAIVFSAVLFGLGHLPALAASFELTPILIARTVVLNAIAGIGFGWLFWRRSLEAAMIAHATFHVALVAVSTVLLLVS